MHTWSDPFLPPALRSGAVDPVAAEPGDSDPSRAALTVVLSLVLIATAVSYAAFYALVVGFPAGAAVLGSGAAAAAGVLAVLRTGWRPRACGHALTAVLYGVVVGLVMHEGGIASIATPWLVTPPTFAILLFGRRSAAAWTVLCVATIGAFHLADAAGVRFPVAYPAAWEPRLTLGSHVGLVVSTAILLFVFERLRARAQTRAEVASAALARMAYEDALTGLANRPRFATRLGQALDRARAADAPGRVAVLVVDLDGFKEINDTLGHAAGDALLAEVAARLCGATRGADTVARMGGDEFAVVLDGIGSDHDAEIVAERIVTALGRPAALAAGEARIGGSVGIARVGDAPAGTTTAALAAALLHDADVAMYRAKALGRGRWVWGRTAEGDAPAAPAALALPAPPAVGAGGTPAPLPRPRVATVA